MVAIRQVHAAWGDWMMDSLIRLLIGGLFLAVLPAAAQTIEYIHTDALGTPIAVTDANRVVIERSEYEPYGKLLNRPLTDGPGFTGHVQDAATGLTYMQQRYYDPTIGRFLSVDPVTAFDGGKPHFNRYWYASNNPYKFKDPDGRAIETVWDVANIAMGVGSFSKNVAMGNYVGAAVDAAGVVVDTAATVVPGVPGGAGAAIKAVRGADTVLEANKAAGKAGEAATRAKLGDKIAGEQVTFKTNDGTRARPDFVTTDKGIVETKTGGAQLTLGQAKLKADVDAGKAVTPVGKNAQKAGLEPGVPTKMTSCMVDRC